MKVRLGIEQCMVFESDYKRHDRQHMPATRVIDDTTRLDDNVNSSLV